MVLLIQPRVGRYERIGIRIPLGLLYISTYLRKNNVDSKIIDTRINKDWKRDVVRELRKHDIIGVTCMVGPQVKHALDIVRFVKSKKPNALVVLGGIHPTLIPENALMEPGIDVVVKGEGEKPFLELAKKHPLSKIKGISYKRLDSKEKYFHNQPQEFLKGEEIPIPDYSFLDMKKYTSISYGGEKGLCIQASRGCPHRCGFCYNIKFNRSVWRPFSVDKVIKNIDILVNKYGAKTLNFVDDTVATDPKRFLELLKKIKEKPYKINLSFQGFRTYNLQKFTDKTYKFLHECGVKTIGIGIESLNEKYLKKMDKSLTTKQTLDILKKIEKQNFNLMIYFITGLPYQTKEEIDYDIEEAKKLAKKHKNSYFIFSSYIPFPGTPLYDEAIRAGFKPPKRFRDWSSFIGTTWRKEYDWLPKKDRRYLENVSFLFTFSNKNILIKVSNKLIRLLLRVYQPIASFRLRKKFHFFMIEKKLTNLLD